MSWYTFKEYLKYRWKAKTRHGVHSPFVFSFIEEVLRDRSSQPLEEKIDTYFKSYQKTVLGELGSGGNYILPAELRNNSIVFVKKIHQDVQHAEAWEQLVADPAVKLSMDIFSVGLLFFKDDFKVKQHFILKYPG